MQEMEEVIRNQVLPFNLYPHSTPGHAQPIELQGTKRSRHRLQP